jgi:heptaprenylglyceryl phosphate synthase
MSVTINGSGQLPVQVISTTKTDVTTISGSATYLDITGLSATITPTNASNKVLVMVTITYGGGGNSYGVARLMRNSTAICLGGSSGSRKLVSTTMGSIDASRPAFTAITFVDSPATTSATTYSVQALSNTGNTIKINTSNEDEDNAVTGLRATSTITVMEISG